MTHHPKHAAKADERSPERELLFLSREELRGPVTSEMYRRAFELAFKAMGLKDHEIGELHLLLREGLGHTPDLAAMEAGWAEMSGRLRGELLTNPAAKALHTLAGQVFQHYRTEIARLKAELDGYEGRTVYHCLERDMAARSAELDAADLPPGTILRATDSSRELVTVDGAWLPRE